MKKTIRNIVLTIIFTISLFIFTGCDPSKYSSDYTKEEATKMMKEYIKEKYGEDVKFEYVKHYSDVALKEILSLGYYAKTTDGYYVRLTDFKGKYETDIRDTKQFNEIEKGIEKYIVDNKISSDYKVSISLENEKNEATFWKSLWSGYPKSAKYEGGDVLEFLKNNESVSETHYTNDIDGGILKVNIVFFTTNDVSIEELNNYTKDLSTKFSCKVSSAVSNEIKDEKSSAASFTNTNNPFVSKLISVYNGSYHSESVSNDIVKLDDNIVINSELEGDKLDSSKWSIKTEENILEVEDSKAKYEVLSKGYKLLTKDNNYIGNTYMSIDVSDIVSANPNEELVLISCAKDDKGWYIMTKVKINKGIHDNNPYISNNKLVFRNTNYSSTSNVYYFVAKMIEEKFYNQDK